MAMGFACFHWMPFSATECILDLCLGFGGLGRDARGSVAKADGGIP